MIDDIVDEFNWPSERTPNEKCRVSVRLSRGTPRVYVEAWANGVCKHKGVTFRPEELEKIIAALQKAKDKIGS